MLSNTLSRIDRLELITARLKSGEPLTVGAIAAEVGVSVRTLNRDIDLLKSRGLPIESEAGRGGGIRLDRRWGVGRKNLNYTEAVDLMISLAIAEQMQSALFMGHLQSIRHKVISSFSPALKQRVEGIKGRIIIGHSATPLVLSGFNSPPRQAVAALHQGFMLQQQLRIDYRDEAGRETQRVIEPHYLFLNYPVWYLLAWDHLRADIRLFRCDRILTSELLSEEFTLRPLEQFQQQREAAAKCQSLDDQAAN